MLLKYYLIGLILTGPAFPFLMVPLYFRYKTLRYRFDDEGVWMAWGLFFRREINLSYRRIQDIHVTRGILQRWMGIATVSIQTAAGSATPEMSIEGILDSDALRDFLYARMRGARADDHPGSTTEAVQQPGDEMLQLLEQIRDGVAGLSARVRALEEARP
ncbi:MAG: PH domain-containing protein [Leptolyngbya sp. PLA3]|nr:MAG: PH domain-containing protein [Cyanobacteria bacterium CYA]MCE7967347.1 PH domain-containing protein [Leptolyngbya sp. PL-A3]